MRRRSAQNRIRVATAGWSIPRASAHRLQGAGSHLERYAQRFRGAEINSSFHRPHSAQTYAKWAACTPPDFRFAIKCPRAITHDLALRRSRIPLAKFITETAGLGRRRGPLLVQLPPSLAFDPQVAGRFFTVLRDIHEGFVVCEPRHASWGSARAQDLLVRHRVARVAADPPPFSGADAPGGWSGILYYRLHGAPRKYWSRYDGNFIAALGETLGKVPSNVPCWCVFDNTASGAALENAWELQMLVDA